MNTPLCWWGGFSEWQAWNKQLLLLATHHQFPLCRPLLTLPASVRTPLRSCVAHGVASAKNTSFILPFLLHFHWVIVKTDQLSALVQQAAQLGWKGKGGRRGEDASLPGRGCKRDCRISSSPPCHQDRTRS